MNTHRINITLVPLLLMVGLFLFTFPGKLAGEVNGSEFAARAETIKFADLDGETDSTFVGETVSLIGPWNQLTMDVTVNGLEDTCYVSLEGSLDDVNWVCLLTDGVESVTTDSLTFRVVYTKAASSPYFRYNIAFSDTSSGQTGIVRMFAGEYSR